MLHSSIHETPNHALTEMKYIEGLIAIHGAPFTYKMVIHSIPPSRSQMAMQNFASGSFEYATPQTSQLRGHVRSQDAAVLRYGAGSPPFADGDAELADGVLLRAAVEGAGRTLFDGVGLALLLAPLVRLIALARCCDCCLQQSYFTTRDKKVAA